MPPRTILALLALAAPASFAQQSPPLPDATVDLRTTTGAALVNATWRYTDAHVVPADFRRAGPDRTPSGPPVRTHDIHPRLNSPDFDAAPWIPVSPDALEDRRGTGLLSFGWYRLDLTVPDQLAAFATRGSTIVLELVVDDYAEVWTGPALAPVLGQDAGPTIAGWNTPQRIVLSSDAQPGQRLSVAVFAANGPLSAPPRNYVWIRSASLDFYAPARAEHLSFPAVETDITRLDPRLDDIIEPGAVARRLASGFVFTEGPVWVPDARDLPSGGGSSGGYLLFSDPNKNVIHRFDPSSGRVSIFRTKSGYSGADGPGITAYRQPGSNGLALDPSGRLTICEHGNRRVSRLEPNGTLSILADRFDSKRLNSPNDLVYRSDGTLYFSDPPFGLPKVFDDPGKALPFSGVFRLRDGRLTLESAELAAPNGLAFSPDERFLYVDNWEESRKVVLRYPVADDGALGSPSLFFDMTSTPGDIALDGLKVDARGNVFVAGPGGVWIIAPDGTHLGTVALPELPANFAFGDRDGRTLYLCARSGLYALRLRVPGAAARSAHALESPRTDPTPR